GTALARQPCAFFSAAPWARPLKKQRAVGAAPSPVRSNGCPWQRRKDGSRGRFNKRRPHPPPVAWPTALGAGCKEDSSAASRPLRLLAFASTTRGMVA